MPMQVRVDPHNPAWAEMFAIEAERIATALGSNFVAAHHVGSTAIPAIVAKPIIDLLIEVAEIDAVDAHNAEMNALEYEAMGELGIPLRRYFRKDNSEGVRTHHVHVFATGNPQIERHLAFRDFMNAHPAWARQYSQLKLELVARYPDSIERYMDGKDSFIKQIDELAAIWRSESSKLTAGSAESTT